MVEGGKAPVFIAVSERNFGVDAVADVKPVGVVLGGCKNDLGFGHISGVDVDPASRAVPCLMGEAFSIRVVLIFIEDKSPGSNKRSKKINFRKMPGPISSR